MKRWCILRPNAAAGHTQYGESIAHVLTQSLAGFAHSNQVLERLVVMLTLLMSCGIWALNGINQQQDHLRHMAFIWILLQMLRLKCGNPSKIHLINASMENRNMCIKNNFKYFWDPFSHK